MTAIRLFVLFLLFSAAGLSAQTKPDALVEYRSGNYNTAVDICRAEIDADGGQNIDSYVVLCWSLIKLGRFNEARPFASTALALSPYDVRLLEIMGEINYHQGRNNEALKYFQDYIHLAPEGQRIDIAYYYMGEIYIRLGRFRHADIALSTALHYVPGNAAWQARLAYARENSGELREAATAYEKALSLDPQLGDARRGLARVHAALTQR
ncbi:MAG: tetratricopeptide repeat protein [Spirochaetaceae bacterium]|jgi:tetratricopeptide (TPR) repeat protein|nr:tetratricopeptide repeat protein [Spirochaetaceae bacterium]